MMLLAIIAKIGLAFSQPATYALVAILGFLTYKPKWFAHALFLLFFTMVYNAYLKSIWQIPLPIYLEGWAFPSGHMHSAVAFWAVIAIQARNVIVWALTLFMLILCGYGLLYEGFHTPIDIFAAYGFGAVTLIIYYFLMKLQFFDVKIYRIGLLTTPLALFIFFFIPQAASKAHLFQALGGSIGLVMGCALCQNDFQTTLKTKLTSVFLAFMGIIGIYMGLAYLPMLITLKIFCQFALMTFWLGVSPCLGNRLTS
jgi:membrane-associated phospholipid phosphatase